MILPRHFRLSFQLFHLRREFQPDVFHPRHVLARIFQPPFGFLAPFLVARHARRFFQKHPQIIGTRLDDARNHALPDDGISARSQPRAQKQVGNILPAHFQMVDEIIRLPRLRQHPLHRQFRILAPLPQRPSQRVVKHQFHRSPRPRLAIRRTIENHIFHGIAPQFRRPRFPQHPSHRVHDIGFTAAIWPHHPHQLPRQGNRNRVGKRFETGKFEFGEAHEWQRAEDRGRKTEDRPPPPGAKVAIISGDEEFFPFGQGCRGDVSSPQAADKVAQSVFLSEGFPGNASVHAGSGVCAAIRAQSRRTADVPLLPSAFPESYFGGLSTV